MLLHTPSHSSSVFPFLYHCRLTLIYHTIPFYGILSHLLGGKRKTWKYLRTNWESHAQCRLLLLPSWTVKCLVNDVWATGKGERTVVGHFLLTSLLTAQLSEEVKGAIWSKQKWATRKWEWGVGAW